MTPVFTQSGIQIHTPRPDAPTFPEYSGFGKRIPLVYQPNGRKLYLGKEGWMHDDVYDHHDLSKDDGFGLDDGYFNGGDQWKNGNLTWYLPEDHDNHEQVANALQEVGFHIPNPLPTQQATYGDDADWEDDDVSGDTRSDLDEWQ